MSKDDIQDLARRAASGDVGAARKLVHVLEARAASGGAQEDAGPSPHEDVVAWLAWRESRGRLGGPAAQRALREAPFMRGYEEVVEQVALQVLADWVSRRSTSSIRPVRRSPTVDEAMGHYSLVLSRVMEDVVGDIGRMAMAVLGLPGAGEDYPGAERASIALRDVAMREASPTLQPMRSGAGQTMLADVRARVSAILEKPEWRGGA